MRAWQQQTTARIDALEAKTDARFQVVDARLDALEQIMTAGFTELREANAKLASQFRWAAGVLLTVNALLGGFIVTLQ